MSLDDNQNVVRREEVPSVDFTSTRTTTSHSIPRQLFWFFSSQSSPADGLIFLCLVSRNIQEYPSIAVLVSHRLLLYLNVQRKITFIKKTLLYPHVYIPLMCVKYMHKAFIL